MRILLAEDERELSRALVVILKHSNFSVDAVYNGQDALDYGLNAEYDTIILDIMMPKMNGLEVLKNLRANKIKTPVIMLTAKAEIEDRVLGLDLGADDYLPKPFEVPELLARLRALTRRKEVHISSVVTFGNLSLNLAGYEVSCGDKTERLTNKEFQMLEMLLTHPNALISTEQFMTKIWGYDSESELNVVWTHISFLRKKLATIGANVQIKAVRGVGYLLEETNA